MACLYTAISNHTFLCVDTAPGFFSIDDIQGCSDIKSSDITVGFPSLSGPLLFSDLSDIQGCTDIMSSDITVRVPITIGPLFICRPPLFGFTCGIRRTRAVPYLLIRTGIVAIGFTGAYRVDDSYGDSPLYPLAYIPELGAIAERFWTGLILTRDRTTGSPTKIKIFLAAAQGFRRCRTYYREALLGRNNSLVFQQFPTHHLSFLAA